MLIPIHHMKGSSMANKKKRSVKMSRKNTRRNKRPVPAIQPTQTVRERLIAHGMAQLKAEESYIWRKIMNFD